MVITFLQREKIQKYLILVFLIIILIIAVILWHVFFREAKFIELIEPKKISIPPKKIEIDFELLKNPIFKELEPFEEIPPFEGEIGRENPFIPY